MTCSDSCMPVRRSSAGHQLIMYPTMSTRTDLHAQGEAACGAVISEESGTTMPTFVFETYCCAWRRRQQLCIQMAAPLACRKRILAGKALKAACSNTMLCWVFRYALRWHAPLRMACNLITNFSSRAAPLRRLKYYLHSLFPNTT